MSKFIQVSENPDIYEVDTNKFQQNGVENSLNMMQHAVVHLMDAAELLEKCGLNIYNYNTLILASDLAHMHTELTKDPVDDKISQETYQNILKEIRTMSLEDEDDWNLDKPNEQ